MGSVPIAGTTSLKPMPDESNAPSLVPPRTLKGFQDYLPTTAIARRRIIDAIVPVYESFGFLPLDTPVLEHLETLIGTGGEDTNKELFRLETPEEEPAAMRFDLTVPFARVVAQYGKEQKLLPFRRYHIGPVFRADKPGPGRFRQFTQCDIDVAGSSSIYIDAEIIAVMSQALQALGLSTDSASPRGFRININSRKLVDAFLDKAAIGQSGDEIRKSVLRVVDKLPKVGLKAIELELAAGRYDDSGAYIKGVGLATDQIQAISAFVQIKAGTRLEILEQVKAHVDSQEAIAEIEGLAEGLEALGVGETEAVFDPSLARGLDYYTGPIFEANLVNSPSFGSIMGGGRYDKLVSRFSELEIPGCGASIGVDRLMDALASVGGLEQSRSITQVLFLKLPKIPEIKLLKLASNLRAEGLSSQVYLMDGKCTFGSQLAFANENAIPIAVIIGEDEINGGTVTIKNLAAARKPISDEKDRAEYLKQNRQSNQVTVPEGDLLKTIRDMLSGD